MAWSQTNSSGNFKGRLSINIKRIEITVFVLLTISLIITSISSTALGNTPKNKKFVLLVLNGLTINDLKDNNFKDITKNSAIGLLNTKTKNKIDNKVAAYLTLGAGAKTQVEQEEIKAYMAREESVVILNWDRILRLSRNIDQSATPGLLGETLKKNKIKFAVLGNSDYINRKEKTIRYQRNIALVAVDRQGMVPGFVGAILNVKDLSANGGYRSNNLLYFSKLYDYIARNDALFIEWGDYSRFDNDTGFMKGKNLIKNTKIINKEAAEFIKQAIDAVKKNSDDYLMLIVSPNQSKRLEKTKSNLTPVLMISNRIKGKIITSDSTKREGIVTNTDIAPTILNFFKIKKQFKFEGSKINAIKNDNSLDYINQLNKKTIDIYAARKVIINIYVLVLVFALVIATLMIIYLKNRRLQRILPPLAFLLSMPLIFLLAPVFSKIYLSIAGIFITGMLLTMFIFLISKDNQARLLLILSATWAAIILDIISGQNLIKYSILGYDPILGARFYGIGNEYMGVLIGSTIMMAAISLQKSIVPLKGIRYILPIFFLITVIVIGHPLLGANVGGMIASALGFVFAAYKLLDVKKMGTLRIIIVAIFLSMFIAVLLVTDVTSKNGFSHAARAIFRISEGGIGEALKIITIKALSNIRLVFYSMWTKLIVVVLAAFIIFLSKSKGIIKEANKKYPVFMKGIESVTIASIAAFIFNDSGVVASAIILIFAIIPLLFIVTDKDIIGSRQ